MNDAASAMTETSPRIAARYAASSGPRASASGGSRYGLSAPDVVGGSNLVWKYSLPSFDDRRGAPMAEGTRRTLRSDGVFPAPRATYSPRYAASASCASGTVFSGLIL